MSPAAERWGLGGNRACKTESAVVDAIWFGTGCHPVRSLHRKPPVYIRFCAPSYEDVIKGVHLKKFRQLVKRSDLRGGDFDKAWSEKGKTLYFANGSTINFKSGQQLVNKFGGDDLDAIYTDEHLLKKYYHENKMRTADRKGFMVFTMTPEEGSITWEKNHIRRRAKSDIFVRRFTIYGNPFLSPEGVAEIERSLTDPRLRDVKLLGKFVALAGMIYPMWNEDIHVIDDREIPRDWYRVVLIDPHIKKETAIIWGVWTPDRAPIVYRCAKVFKTVPELKKYIRVRTAGERISLWIGDEAMGGDGKNIYGQDSVLKQLASGDDAIPVIPTNQSSDKSFQAGVNKVRDMLTPDAVSQLPRLQVMKSCVGVIDEFEEYQFIPDQIADDMTFRERVRRVEDDYMDLIRYMVMAGPIYESKEGPVIVLPKGRRSKHTGRV